jgi:hypothetical protein
MPSRDLDPAHRTGADAERDDAPKAAVHSALQLQRTVGNQAAMRVLARLAIKAEDLGSTGGMGKIKAVVGMSDYTKLREALDEFHHTPSLKRRGELVARMRELAGRWLKANASGKSSGNSDRVRKVTELLAALDEEEGVLAQQGGYMAKLKKPGAFEWLSAPSAMFGAKPAEELAAGKLGARGTSGLTSESSQLMHEHGLTEADLAAIRIYSLDEFKYINPALAGNRGWLQGAAGKVMRPGAAGDRVKNKTATDADWNKMEAEGLEHAGMVKSALEKLPLYPRATFRGEQLTQAEADQRWTEGASFTTNYFYSTSRNEQIAAHFARHPPDATKPVKVVIEFEQKTGRDISELSAAPSNAALAKAGLGDKEEEVLLLPGTTIAVVSVDRTGPLWRVKAKEVDSPPPPPKGLDDLTIPAQMPPLPPVPRKAPPPLMGGHRRR